MEIRTGVTIPIERNGEHVGDLRFDPGDVVFMEKVYGLISEWDQKEKEYEVRAKALEDDNEEDGSGIPKNAPDRLKFLKEMCRGFRSQIDVIFGDGTSEMIFGDALSPDGIGMFFEEITPYMESARSSKMDKYLNREQRRALKK